MLLHDELYHYGIKGMRWGVRSRVRVNLESERKAAQKNFADYKSGKIGDREYSRREARIRESIRNKERKAARGERDTKRKLAVAKVQSMPNTQNKADKVVSLTTKQQGLFATRDAAKKARLEALAKSGFSQGQAKRGLRSYENAMYGVSAGLMTTSLVSAGMILKGKRGAGILDYAIAAGIGAGIGRGVARIVSDRKGEGTPLSKKPNKSKKRLTWKDRALSDARGH